MQKITLDPQQKLQDLQERLHDVERGLVDVMPELTVRRDRYTKALIAEGGELNRGRVQAVEEIINLPVTLRQQIYDLQRDIEAERSRQIRPATEEGPI